MEFREEPFRIYLERDGKLLAEITFPLEDGVYHLNHTFVDDSLRGQGIAGQLVEQAAKLIRREGGKAKPTCSYAVKWFEKHPEYQELLQA